jgi:amino acid adenylation domain-containing protein
MSIDMTKVDDFRSPIEEPRFKSIVETFRNCVDRHPDAPAIVRGDDRLSYLELQTMVTALCRVLRNMGVKTGDTVAVSGTRSAEIVIAITAVFAARAVLVIVDESLPEARKELFIRESGASYRIDATAQTVGGIQGISPDGAAILRGWAETSAVDDEINSFPGSDEAAYIFFTSGTTGTPKAVVGCHKGLSHFLDWQRRHFNVGVGDRCAQLINLSFDAVLRDIFLPLTSGACLCIPESSEVAAGQTIGWIARQSITILHTVPTLMRAWIQSSLTHEVAGALRFAFLSGEGLPKKLVEDIRAVFVNSTVVNFYGPTETVFIKTFYVVPEPPRDGIQLVGKPLPQTQILLFKDRETVCSPGETGEVVIRTPFRTLGYLNEQHDKTSGFQPNPFTSDPHDLVYFTGDLGRLNGNDELEIVGRLDDQLKIRGVRVDPTEIRAALERHEEVKQCEVVGITGPKGMELVAFVIPSVSPGPEARALREHLARLVPSSLIPSKFYSLNSFPVGPTGKVQKKELLALASRPRQSGMTRREQPSAGKEAILAAICRSALRQDRIGRHEDLFDAGLDSLSCVELVVAARAQGLALQEQDILDHPTIAELAIALDSRPNQSNNPLGAEAPASFEAPLLPAQEDILQLKSPGTFVMRPIVFSSTRRISPARVSDAVRILISWHPALKTRFIKTKTGWRQALDPDYPSDVDVVVLRANASYERLDSDPEMATTLRRLTTFDVERGPLLSVLLVRGFRGMRDDLVIVFLHHLVADGYSERILTKDLGMLLVDKRRKAHRGATGDAVGRWGRYLEGMVAAEDPILLSECSYWLKQINQKRPLPKIRGDAKAIQNPRRVLFKLSITASRVLQEAPSVFGCGVRDLCLAAYAKAIARVTGLSGFWVDIVHHGRTEAPSGMDLTHAVGCFYWLFPVWIDAMKERLSPSSVEKLLSGVPRNGLAFAVYRWMADKDGISRQLKEVRPCFYLNYVGGSDSIQSRDDWLSPIPSSSIWSPSPKDLSVNLETPIRMFVLRNGNDFEGYLYYDENLTTLEPVTQLPELFDAELCAASDFGG